MTTKSVLCAVTAAGLLTVWPNTPVHAAIHPAFSEKQIVVDGSTYSRPFGFVYKGTTYMPIWYIMQVFKELQVKNTWSSNTWALTTPAYVSLSYKQLTTGTTGAKITVNGHLEERVPKLVATDPASGGQTTFMPIWYVMQLMNQFKIKSTWNGQSWTLNTSNSILRGTPVQSDGTGDGGGANQGIANQYGMTDDSAYFARSSGNMYLSAQTGDPSAANPSTTSMNAVQPNQNVYLFGWREGQSVDSRTTTWFVNSENATVSADVSHHYTLDSTSGTDYSVAAGVFRADKPGVYTVQAETPDHVYSVPLVLIVGLSSDWNQPVSRPEDLSGVRAYAETGTTPIATRSNGHGTTFSIYSATSDGWIPIQGHTKPGAKQVQVTFGDNPGTPKWSYALPVDADGNFSAQVRSPVSGTMTMWLFTNYTDDLTNWANGKSAVDNPQSVSVIVSAPAPLPASVDIYASAKMDYNLNPAFGALAKALVNQAGSVDSGIEAINNYVAEDVIYDQTEQQPTQYRFQDSAKTWTTKLGVCEDFAELEASMLKAIGIRAETIQGVAVTAVGVTDRSTDNGDNHEWLKVYDGSKWILADPTWSSADTSTTDWLNNEFFTDTVAFANTHKEDPTAVGSSE